MSFDTVNMVGGVMFRACHFQDGWIFLQISLNGAGKMFTVINFHLLSPPWKGLLLPKVESVLSWFAGLHIN